MSAKRTIRVVVAGALIAASVPALANHPYRDRGYEYGRAASSTAIRSVRSSCNGRFTSSAEWLSIGPCTSIGRSYVERPVYVDPPAPVYGPPVYEPAPVYYPGPTQAAYPPPAQVNVLGTAAGAVVGAVIGSQIGHGSGRGAATAVGAVIGGMLGSQF